MKNDLVIGDTDLRKKVRQDKCRSQRVAQAEKLSWGSFKVSSPKKLAYAQLPGSPAAAAAPNFPTMNLFVC